MSDLASKQCVPCRGGVPPLTEAERERLLGELGGGWQVINAHHLEKEYAFKSYREGLDFTVRLAELADGQGHHPDILLAWRRVRVTVWTHKIDGLTESDFILAAKADRL